MVENSHRDLLVETVNRMAPAAIESPEDDQALTTRAREWARSLSWLPSVRESEYVPGKFERLNRRLEKLLNEAEADAPGGTKLSEDRQWLHDNARLVRLAQKELQEAASTLRRTPQVRTPDKVTKPRVVAVAEDFLATVDYRYSDHSFSAYVEGFQKISVLNMGELSLVVPSLKLALLEEIARRGDAALRSTEPQRIGVLIDSLRNAIEAPWKELLEPLIVFDKVLQQDTSEAYARSDFQTRELYRHTVAHLAEHSDCSELEIAQLALSLAQESQKQKHRDFRVTWRKGHVGYYLIGEGLPQLQRQAGVRVPLGERIQAFLRRHPDEFYLGGIEVLTLLIVIAIMTPVFNNFYNFLGRIFAILVLLLPASQSAVEVMNYLTTTLLRPRILPKLDFSKGIPDDCVTMVVVPTLLLNEKQVRRLVDDLEVRYLGNMSRNLHFALLSDMPDSDETPNEEDPLVDLCTELILALNEKYAEKSAGSFFLFHRHRVYNPREGVWMGWERKRGKLLDFNRLIKGKYDSFAVKIGDLTLLPEVRFVLTLDSDTELPRNTAYRLVGAITHPLNQAIVDPQRNIVTAGYGILQPRVGISVQSAAQSRLASIYSGQTGFDIYTRAISDVYQDLNGEGIFTGKGLYEVDTLHQVLEHRFPRNSLLSHDLIEGAYARAGLVSDVEVIDDYPSHYSAYNRRKHRWLRGDWQIVPWLFARVPDESGRRVANPISFLSRWKILDNLRRSLVEAGTFLLFLLGWTLLPGRPVYWTLVTVAILFVPPFFQFAFSSVRSLLAGRVSPIRDALEGLGTSLVGVFLILISLAHQTLLSADAVLRTLYRRMVSRERLLEWETAAEAELGTRKKTPVDILLNWTPALALAVGVLVYFARRPAIYAAVPILFLWALAKPMSVWLNRPPRPLRKAATPQDERFLRKAALHTWRYFAEFSNAEHNWLIPDNVQEQPQKVAARTSPTNLGFLLNARQVACEFGYLTVPEFAQLTSRTLQTILRLPRQRGHLFNWYATQTLEPDRPRFISTVDNGNFVASLITLEQGCLDLLRHPVLRPALLAGYADHLCALAELKLVSKRVAQSYEADDGSSWLERMLAPVDLPPVNDGMEGASDARWLASRTTELGRSVRQAVADYMPWLRQEYAGIRADSWLKLDSEGETVVLGQLPTFIDQLEEKLQDRTVDAANRALRDQLLKELTLARRNADRLIAELRKIASQSETLIREMDFSFLLDKRRKLLSIGSDAESGKVHAACYDLLASEARIASFLSVAKGEIPQESWFTMGRSHVVDHGNPLLISWTGTMFEYLMPGLWLRAYPETMLERSRSAAVRAQQLYADDHRIPWGISESGYAVIEENGNYSYRAFGVPHLAVNQEEAPRLVVAPYATMLALDVDPAAAIKNLRWMAKKGWLGRYGFYEAADFSPEVRPSRRQRYALVRSWMVHHQGMSLLAIANFLDNGVVQNWFHCDARVQATELLLQERPVRHVPGTPPKKKRSRPNRKTVTNKEPVAA